MQERSWCHKCSRRCRCGTAARPNPRAHSANSGAERVLKDPRAGLGPPLGNPLLAESSRRLNPHTSSKAKRATQNGSEPPRATAATADDGAGTDGGGAPAGTSAPPPRRAPQPPPCAGKRRKWRRRCPRRGAPRPAPGRQRWRRMSIAERAFKRSAAFPHLSDLRSSGRRSRAAEHHLLQHQVCPEPA